MDCERCGKEIVGGDYFLVGIQRTPEDMWRSVYYCRSGGCYKGPSIMSSYVATVEDTEPPRCLYCGKNCEARFCSDRCRAMHEQEMADRVKPVALQELIAALSTIRERSAVNQEPRPAYESHATAIMTDGRSKPTPKSLPLPQVEKLDPFVPQNEDGVIFMLGAVIDRIRYRMAHIDGRYPDCVLQSPSGQMLKVELEYASSNFISHGHDASICDLVICWKKDADLPIEVLELSRYYNPASGAWNFTDLARLSAR